MQEVCYNHCNNKLCGCFAVMRKETGNEDTMKKAYSFAYAYFYFYFCFDKKEE